MPEKGKADKAEEEAVVERSKKMKDEVGAIKSAEESRLQSILADADNLLRQTIILEAEVTTHNVRKTELEKRLRDLKSEEESITSTVKKLEIQLSGAETKQGEMHSTVDKLRHKINDTDQAVAKLEVEQDALSKEIERLEKSKTRMEDDVKRLQKLREEYMSAIAQFKEKKDDLTS